MSITQIHNFFAQLNYRVGVVHLNYFDLHSQALTQAHIKVGYLDNVRQVYMSAYYTAQHRNAYYVAYQNRGQLANNLRNSLHWNGICNAIGQNPQTWAGIWRPLGNNPTNTQQAYCQFRFANPYPNGQLSMNFLNAMKQLADLIFQNYC